MGRRQAKLASLVEFVVRLKREKLAAVEQSAVAQIELELRLERVAGSVQG